jgi:hypothetical protein
MAFSQSSAMRIRSEIVRVARHRFARTAVAAIGRPLIAALAVSVTGGTSLLAQTTVEGIGGMTMRYHGDTIWRERDSTASRVVLRGDTAKRANFMHGKLTYTATYVLRGDMVRLVEQRDADGKLRAIPDTSRLVPSSLVTGELQMLETSIRSNAMQARNAARGLSMPTDDAPLRASTSITYPVSANLTIVHHQDTVRYIRGCLAAPPIDTTMYVILPGDSLRRVSPAPRMFGKQMLMAVRADMNSVLLRRRVSTMSEPTDNLPHLKKWPCDNR